MSKKPWFKPLLLYIFIWSLQEGIWLVDYFNQFCQSFDSKAKIEQHSIILQELVALYSNNPDCFLKTLISDELFTIYLYETNISTSAPIDLIRKKMVLHGLKGASFYFPIYNDCKTVEQIAAKLQLPENIAPFLMEEHFYDETFPQLCKILFGEFPMGYDPIFQTYMNVLSINQDIFVQAFLFPPY